MVLWPFVPLQLTEAIEALTDSLDAKAASQRMALRSAPRQSLVMDHRLTGPQATRARALVYGLGTDLIAVPAWAEYRALGAVSAGAGSLSFDTGEADYREGGYALIWDDDDACELVEIATVGAAALTLADPVAGDYADAVVAPVRLAYAPDGLSLAREEDDEFTARIHFLVQDNVDLGDETAYPVYRGLPVFIEPAVVADGLDEAVHRELELFDAQTGGLAVAEFRAEPRQTFQLSQHPEDRAALWRHRRWLHARRGRQRAFWLPTWGDDLRLAAPAGAADTTLTIESVAWAGNLGARDIQLRTAAGTLYRRRVLSAAAGDPGQEVLTLDAALGVALAVDQVERISLMHCVVQLADRVEIEHQPGQWSRWSVPLIEVPVP